MLPIRHGRNKNAARRQPELNSRTLPLILVADSLSWKEPTNSAEAHHCQKREFSITLTGNMARAGSELISTSL